MNIRNRITDAMSAALSTFYRGPLKTLIQAVGLNVYLHRIYWAVFLAIADPKLVKIGNSHAMFRVSTRQEYRRLETLMGEEKVLESILNELRPSEIVYDIGANIGTYTCPITNALSTGRVLAFEPHPETADRLERNAEINQGDVSVFRYALSNTSGKDGLVPSGDKLGTGEHALATDSNPAAITVNMISGDELISEEDLPRPNVLKIDVEGAELQVLKGLRETLANQECRLVYCEVHRKKLAQFDGDEAAVRRELKQAGFEVERIYERGEEYFLRASR